MLWNLPTYYIWQHVVTWVCSILPLIDDPYLGRIVRTNESGFQIFWMQFRTVEGAQRFRGVVQGLLLGPDETRINCDFVKQDEFNGAGGRSSDQWTHKGLTHNRSLLEAFSDSFCRPAVAEPSLLSRLTMTPQDPSAVPLIARLSKSARRRQNNPKPRVKKAKQKKPATMDLDAADGGAL